MARRMRSPSWIAPSMSAPGARTMNSPPCTQYAPSVARSAPWIALAATRRTSSPASRPCASLIFSSSSRSMVSRAKGSLWRCARAKEPRSWLSSARLFGMPVVKSMCATSAACRCDALMRNSARARAWTSIGSGSPHMHSSAPPSRPATRSATVPSRASNMTGKNSRAAAFRRRHRSMPARPGVETSTTARSKGPRCVNVASASAGSWTTTTSCPSLLRIPSTRSAVAGSPSTARIRVISAR